MCLCSICIKGVWDRAQFLQSAIDKAAPQTILDLAQAIAFVPEELYVELQKVTHVKVTSARIFWSSRSLDITTTRGDISCKYLAEKHECVLFNWDMSGIAAYYRSRGLARRYRRCGDIRAVSTESDKYNNSARIFHWLIYGTTSPEEVKIMAAIAATLPQPIAEEITTLLLSISTDRELEEYGSDEANMQIIDTLCKEQKRCIWILLRGEKYDTRWEHWRDFIISNSEVS